MPQNGGGRGREVIREGWGLITKIDFQTRVLLDRGGGRKSRGGTL